MALVGNVGRTDRLLRIISGVALGVVAFFLPVSPVVRWVLGGLGVFLFIEGAVGY